MDAEYFERGCLCFLSGKIAPPKPNEDKVQYYMKNCTCSRHPNNMKHQGWDQKNPFARKEALAIIAKRHPNLKTANLAST